MDIRIDKRLKTPVYLQIVSAIKQEIAAGVVTQERILPSERVLAKMLGVHRNTVAKAYSELKGQGLIESYPGVGYRVYDSRQEIGQGPAAAGRQSRQSKKVNWLDQIKPEYLDMTVTFDKLFQRFSQPDKISLGSGIAATGLYDREKLSRRIADIVSHEGKKQSERMLRDSIRAVCRHADDGDASGKGIGAIDIVEARRPHGDQLHALRGKDIYRIPVHRAVHERADHVSACSHHRRMPAERGLMVDDIISEGLVRGFEMLSVIRLCIEKDYLHILPPA